MAPKNEDFPSAIEAFFLIVALFALEYVAAAALMDLRALSGLDPRRTPGVVALFGNGALFCFLLHYKRMTYRTLFHPSSKSFASTAFSLTMPVLLIAPGLVLVGWTLDSVLEWALPPSATQQEMFDAMASIDLPNLVTSIILAPVLEEMLFRGIILRSFLHRYKRSSAIVGSAALFGFAHLNAYQFVVASVLGIALGWLYERSRSLWPCILLHGTSNALAITICSILSATKPGENWHPPTEYWISAFALASIGVTLLQKMLSPQKKTPERV